MTNQYLGSSCAAASFGWCLASGASRAGRGGALRLGVKNENVRIAWDSRFSQEVYYGVKKMHQQASI